MVYPALPINKHRTACYITYIFNDAHILYSYYILRIIPFTNHLRGICYRQQWYDNIILLISIIRRRLPRNTVVCC